MPGRYGLREEPDRGAEKKGVLTSRMPYPYSYNSEGSVQNLEAGFVSLAHHHVSDIDNLAVDGPFDPVPADLNDFASVRPSGFLAQKGVPAPPRDRFPSVPMHHSR